MLFLETGRGEHRIDFVPYPVENGSVYVLRPGQVHELRLSAGSTGFLLQFSPGFFDEGNRPAAQTLRKLGGYPYVRPSSFGALLMLVRYLADEIERKQEGYSHMIRSGLTMVLTDLARYIPETGPADSYLLDRMEELNDLIRTHVFRQKQVSFYAGRLNLTAYQLNAATKTVLGKTCSEVIRDAIILEAKRSLRATTDPISRIAWQLGYEDASYFVRFFRKYTGQTPEAFRQNFR